MSYGETEDLNTLVTKLANLMSNTIKGCIRNYEALLPYLGKKETNSKICHKLVKVNLLLNKLNEELLGLRVECITDSSYEEKGESALSEGGRKRRMFDVLELGRHETKHIKMEVPFSNNTKCSIALTPETGISMQSENLESMDTEEACNTQLQTLDIYNVKNIKMEMQESDEVENVCEFSGSNNQTPAAQKFSMLVGERGNSCNKGERRAPHSPVRYIKDDTPVRRSEELWSVDDELYGIIKLTTGRYRCTLCNRKLVCEVAVLGHLTGKQHKTKRITAKNSYKNKLYNYQAVQSHAKENNFEMKQKIAQKNSCSKECEVPRNSCESTDSVSVCSAVSCSLADTVAIVEDRHQVLSMKHAVRLDDIWSYFYAPFHVNKKFFRFHSGKITCSLCYEQVGSNILSVRAHISRVGHLDRINILQNIELENKSSNKQLLDIPGSLKNIVPATQFILRHKGFFCSVCKYFCENSVVLSHMTGASHGEKLDEMKKSV